MIPRTRYIFLAFGIAASPVASAHATPPSERHAEPCVNPVLKQFGNTPVPALLVVGQFRAAAGLALLAVGHLEP